MGEGLEASYYVLLLECPCARFRPPSSSSLPRLVAIEAEGCVVLRVALFAAVPAQHAAAILIGKRDKTG